MSEFTQIERSKKMRGFTQRIHKNEKDPKYERN